MTELSPSYLDMNFDSIKSDIQDKMAESPVFQSYKNDASNITILIELMAYLGELNAYYLNKLAKNVYIDTADVRENIVRLGYLVGYYPKGYRSARTTLTVTVPSAGIYPEYGCQIGDTIQVNAWKEIYTDSTQAAYDGSAIYFTTTNDVYETITSFPVTLSVPISQGRVKTYNYYGRDLIDETLYLPTIDFGYDDNLDDNYPSVEVRVNGTTWTRISDFYDDLSGLEDDDNVYVLRYNKYDQYIIRFSNIRSVPTTNDTIDVYLIDTLGYNGNVGSNTVVNVHNSDFITVTPSSGPEFSLGSTWYSITNGTAATGGLDAETNDEIKTSIEGMANAQYRCVTRTDYISYLEAHNDVCKAIAWGEKESTLGGNILEYNKVYLSIYPNSWDNLTYTINDDGIYVAASYAPAFLTTMSEYLEPRKMLCAYEEYVIPDFTYLRFNISIKIKRNYRYANVREDVKNKLVYYFNASNRSFGETISFMDITNYILDQANTSTTDSFPNTKGIYYLNIRDIDFYELSTRRWINPYAYGNTYYPQWSTSDSSYWEENTLKDILLDFDQFPILSIDDCNFTEDV